MITAIVLGGCLSCSVTPLNNVDFPLNIIYQFPVIADYIPCCIIKYPQSYLPYLHHMSIFLNTFSDLFGMRQISPTTFPSQVSTVGYIQWWTHLKGHWLLDERGFVLVVLKKHCGWNSTKQMHKKHEKWCVNCFTNHRYEIMSEAFQGFI